MKPLIALLRSPLIPALFLILILLATTTVLARQKSSANQQNELESADSYNYQDSKETDYEQLAPDDDEERSAADGESRLDLGNDVTLPPSKATTTKAPTTSGSASTATKRPPTTTTSAAETTDAPSTKSPNTTASPKNSTAAMERLKAKGKSMPVRNVSIEINGRKFDQVKRIECVDEQFYKLLMDDLALIEPARRVDFYGSYYDDEYAKVMGAIVENFAPPEASSGSRRQEKAHENGRVLAASELLAEVKRLWRQTNETFTNTKASLASESARLSRLRRETGSFAPADNRTKVKKKPVSTANFEPKPRHRMALANHKYLLKRIEMLKALLLNGEESLIVLNNKVKKLNQAVGEEELQMALCSCITSRSGRAALMLINELFVDKNSAQLLSKPELASKRAKETAEDSAEFCAYWYGDTIRSQVKQKEVKIRRLVLQVLKDRLKQKPPVRKVKKRRRRKKKPSSPSAAETTTTSRRPTTKQSARKVIKYKKIIRTKVVTKIVQMTTLWLPSLATWINSTLRAYNLTKDNLTMAVMMATTSEPTSLNRKSRFARSIHASDEEGASMASFSTPFDERSNYADLDQTANEFGETIEPSFGDAEFRLARRKKREAKLASGKSEVTSRPTEAASNGKEEADFEQRISKRSAKCASDGFSELISIAYDQSALMYESTSIAKNHTYIKTLVSAFSDSFGQFWLQKRDHWSKELANGGTNGSANANAITNGGANSNISSTINHDSNYRSLNEEIDNAFEASMGSYERGARLGYTIGAFIGEKAARQWPEPEELNTFTYDSLFLAGVGLDHSLNASRALEQLIVAETVKRVAFAEANRQSFAKSLHSAYLNGASVVPVWGVLHAQRVVAKQLAKEGAKVGYEAASRAAQDFAPEAIKFFRTNKHQRSLAAPYKAAQSGNWAKAGDNWAGLSEQVNELALEGRIYHNLSNSAVECGKKSGALMGALLGLIVAPEAFETYTRFKGSLEALENEFNQYKLGALRGYELGETWAYLNYTAELNHNLDTMKKRMGVESSKNGTASVARLQPTGSVLETNKSRPENTNNVFQFMVLNYGPNLVANHSRSHLLKLRPLEMDELLLTDLKAQSGDLLADPRETLNKQQQLDDDDDFFESGGVQSAGELTGEFNTIDNKRKRPIKFNLIDLGPTLEFEDELAKDTTTKNNSSSKSSSSALENTPLTVALAKLGKIFMKISVARRKRTHKEGAGSAVSSDDELARYLNADSFDQGDGYLCGTFSRIATSHLTSGDSDDFSLEETLLDELSRRIEKVPLKVGAVNLVENVMRLSTLAPQKIVTVSTTMRPTPRATRSATTRASGAGRGSSYIHSDKLIRG